LHERAGIPESRESRRFNVADPLCGQLVAFGDRVQRLGHSVESQSSPGDGAFTDW
jgi:hypothetical protein